MSYSVYFKYGNEKYKLPVNPEEIKRSRSLSVEKYQVLNGRQVSIPAGCALEEFSFEAEFPGREYHYMEFGARADADYYEKMFKEAQQEQEPVRFIASNGITEDISVLVLVESVESVEKAGEEGDKYLTLKLLEYGDIGARYVAVQTPAGTVKQEEQTENTGNPAVTEDKTHMVEAQDTLWSLARKYYGNGEMYTKIAAANPSLKNPNLIVTGQVLLIPA